MATVLVPTPLRKFTGQAARVHVAASTVAAALTELARLHPGLEKHIRTLDGAIPSFLNVFVGDEDIRSLEHEHTAVAESTLISLVPAIAGGSK